MLELQSPPVPKDKCSNCGKTESLKRCSRCRESIYCSVDCQKADWKRRHKGNNCTFAAIRNNYLIDTTKSETEAFDYVIGAYRLRVEDDYKFLGENHGLYSGENPLEDFREFLDLAEKLLKKDKAQEKINKAQADNDSEREDAKDGPEKSGILPLWWDKAKRRQCEMRALSSGSWADIGCAVEKHDIQEHYKDPLMPMKLRMLAEIVYDRSPMPI